MSRQNGHFGKKEPGRAKACFLGPLLAVWLLAAGTVWGQTAEDYYHHGAQNYIGAALQEAIAAVEKGLQIDPDNPKLQALLEKLKEQQKQQQNQQNQSSSQQQQQQQQQQNQPSQQEQEPPQDQEQQNQPNPPDQQQPPEDSEQPPQPQELEQKEISKEDAERILQALLSKEKENKELRRPKVAKKKKVTKDW